MSHFRTLTLKTIPATPSSLNANAFYKGANLSWLPSSSAEEYIIYMDGEQLFKTANTSAKVTNLVNGADYDFAVSASNDIGESDLSNTVTVTPTDSSPVDVTLGYSLKDISDGTANMFSAEWLLLAFCIAIPLSFYISNRIKGLINS
ncbi:Exochitinase 1 precursor [compost metagenome]